MNLVRQSYIHVNVQDVGNRVQGIDDKLDQANCSLSLNPDSHSTRSRTCASLQQYARMLTADSQSSLTRPFTPQ